MVFNNNERFTGINSIGSIRFFAKSNLNNLKLEIKIEKKGQKSHNNFISNKKIKEMLNKIIPAIN